MADRLRAAVHKRVLFVVTIFEGEPDPHYLVGRRRARHPLSGGERESQTPTVLVPSTAKSAAFVHGEPQLETSYGL
jgi:hypothetical protein